MLLYSASHHARLGRVLCDVASALQWRYDTARNDDGVNGRTLGAFLKGLSDVLCLYCVCDMPRTVLYDTTVSE